MRTLARSTFLIAALAAACGGNSPGSTTPTAATPTGRHSLTEGASTTVAPVVDGPTAEEAFAWVQQTIEAGGKPTATDVQEHFAPEFLKQVPADQVIAIFGQLAAQLPPLKELKREGKAPSELNVLLDTAAGGVRVTLKMSEARPRQISTLLFQPATSEAPPRTYGDAVAQLQQAASKSQLFVAEIVKDKCVPLQNHHSTDRLAIGSAMKLWVLLALDTRVEEDKKVTWDTTLAIRDEAKSLPTGEMQDLAAGTQRTLRDFAANMISISDNTATDHLIDFLGREEVERALRQASHGDPAANTPFLRTRELFALKLALTADEQATYRKMPAAAKKKVLDGYRQRPIDLEQAMKDWTAPRALDFEWFASGPDLCNVMEELGRHAGWKPDSDVLAILAKNPGAPFDKSKWSYIGFKGGSEPGVMNLTWLGHRIDGKWFVVSTTVNDDQKTIDEALVVNAASGALAILGNEAATPAPATP